MACFCKDSVSSLALMLPSLNLSAAATASLSIAASAQVGEMARLLLQIGMPWTPDPNWLRIQLPSVSLSATAIATLSAFAQLRAMATLLGLDLSTAVTASAMAQLSATVAARMNALLALRINLNPLPWSQMSATLQACAQIQAALRVNFLAPLNIDVALWTPFLMQLQALLPVITLMAQLNLSASAHFSAELAVALKLMLGIPMPHMSPIVLSFMASLTSTLTAMAHLRLALGIDPLQVGLPAIRLMVEERVTATIAMVEQVLGMPFAAALKLMIGLPKLPTIIATPLNVRLAASLQVPPINWNIPVVASLPVLTTGLPILAFCAQLKAALNLPINLSPCMAGCDAAALMAA